MLLAMEAAAEGFALLGPEHLGAIAAIALATVAGCALLRSTATRPYGDVIRFTLFVAIALLLLGSAASLWIQQAFEGRWTLRSSLPLHLCDLALFTTAAALLGLARSRGGDLQQIAGRQVERGWRQTLYELAYFWALAGTIQGVLTPEITDPFPSLMFVRFFVSHGGVIMSALLMTFGLNLRPRPSALPRVWLITAATALLVGVVDALTGANYMYLCGPPARSSIYDYFGRWPLSLVTLTLVGTVMLAVWYLPFWLLDRRRALRSPQTHSTTPTGN